MDEFMAHAEAAYLIKRWDVTVSTRGFVWIRPVGSRISPEELAGFLVMFQRCCDERFPAAAIFDFHRCDVVGEQWCLLRDLLHDFADQLGARCGFTSANGRPASAAVISRRVPGSGSCTTM